MVNSNNLLPELQKTEQEILDTVVEFCNKHQIDYILGYGTLLGAVRHKGFIPWDDDIDIVMKRDDYNKFCIEWENEHPSGYTLSNYVNNKYHGSNFMKVLKEHTVILGREYSEFERNQNGMIWIDILPMDIVPKKRFDRFKQMIASIVNILFAQGYLDGFRIDFGVKYIAGYLLYRPFRNKRIDILNKTDRLKTKWNNQRGKYVNASCIREATMYYPEDLFDEIVELEFNGKMYKSTSRYKEFLEIYFGDYMQLPPENERVPFHHPIIVDCHRDYGEYLLSINSETENSKNI